MKLLNNCGFVNFWNFLKKGPNCNNDTFWINAKSKKLKNTQKRLKDNLNYWFYLQKKNYLVNYGIF